MAAFLIVPPAEVFSDKASTHSEILASLNDFAIAQARELGVVLPGAEIQNGPFRGTRIYEWKASFTGILYVSSLFPPSSLGRPEFLRISTVIRRDDCKHLGSNWRFEKAEDAGLPAFLKNNETGLQDFLSRSLSEKNVIRIQSTVSGKFGKQGRRILEAFLAEEFSKNSIPVDAPFGRIWCDAVLPQVSPAVQREYPGRPHRILMAQLQENSTPKNTWWPTGKGILKTVAPFAGEDLGTHWEQKEPAVFDPHLFVTEAVEKVLPSLHDLNELRFEVKKRQGRWLTIDRGRALGLTIGARLVGPGGAGLHVIHFERGPGLEDGAVAYLRHESADAPLKAGDVLTLDPTVYPK